MFGNTCVSIMSEQVVTRDVNKGVGSSGQQVRFRYTKDRQVVVSNKVENGCKLVGQAIYIYMRDCQAGGMGMKEGEGDEMSTGRIVLLVSPTRRGSVRQRISGTSSARDMGCAKSTG